MISSRYGFGLSVALSFASFGFLLSAPVQAQEEAPPPNEDPAQQAADQAAENEEEEAESEAAPEPALTKPEPGVKPEDKPQEPPPPPETTASQTSAAREVTVSMVGVERLPGSAYPAVQTRGIKYGSLWMTFHGQQWPYMPKIQGEDSLRIGFSGSIWNDLSYTKLDADSKLEGLEDVSRLATQTRGVLRVTPTYTANDDWFLQGNAEFVVQGNMRPDPGTGVLGTTDDLWVRVGKWDVFDITVGRFQGWEIANHYGMALDQNTLERQGAAFPSTNTAKPTDGYGLSYFWDRQDNLLGAYAAHVYPTKYLRGELLGHFGAGSNPYVFSPNQIDVRPSVIFDIGYLKLKAGYEYGTVSSQDAGHKEEGSRRNGYGFAAQVVLDPYVEFGGSFARGFEDVLDKDGQADLNSSNTVGTYGGFLNASPGYKPLVFGFGAFLNHWEDMRIDNVPGPHYGKVDTNDQWLLFGAVQYTLWEQLYFKFVVSSASNKAEHFKDGEYVNNALSTRFRMTVLF
jgi:hypothetical protein